VPVVIVMNVEHAQKKPDDFDIDDILECACGAWSSGKILDEIDKEINEMRREWDRGWDWGVKFGAILSFIFHPVFKLRLEIRFLAKIGDR